MSDKKAGRPLSENPLLERNYLRVDQLISISFFKFLIE